ncbi:type II toxin-antitoxin system PemK/MazF family toxin [Gloeocapsopsis sp. IPPAS B-1203]|uniref:type II toxin-antitoxin system PemK/MazF family toxin n=1 Tax=Gloeocapsopsis sp. IPPAS B-1203 TaxID=2049454 RepID=UPI000C19C883|nr:type II toxin-antitoxin system PemK/MazF family toxin [Gloeocapsopsis sp. IPPAS B-1203]PIG91796.1 PemK family transcriptional regulator [Gloeocapsopsis sp. IPPAS B-1203]
MPKGKLTYRRGDIYWVAMEPTVGAEVQKTRSCLVIQNDTMNQYGQVTIVLPFRPGSKQAPYAVNVEASLTNGLDKARFVDVGQIRAVSYQRMRNKVGVIEAHYWQQIRQALDIVLGFDLIDP